MSEFIAEAQVLIRPDVSKFAATLQAELLVATKAIKPITVPVIPVASEAAGAAATLATQNTKISRSAAEAAGAQETLARSTKKSTAALLGAESAAGRLDAALLGLRTLAGSSAVIGLGALALAAIAAGKAIRASIQGAASLEQELNVFRVTAGATAEQMTQVSKAAEALGKDITLPAVTSADAAVAFTELAKAGLSVNDALEGGRGVLELSAAAQIDFASAAELTANALNAFQLQGNQAVHVADLLANASIQAQGSVEDMGLALRQSAAVAHQLGLSVETTVAFITELARAGIAGSDAGTSLRVALTRLIAPTDKAQQLIKKFGINLRDAQGNLRADVFVQLGRAMEELGKQERARDLFLIFGQDAQRAAAILSQNTLPALNETIAAVERQGAAAELAGARNAGFTGKLSALQSSLQTLGTAAGKIALGPLGDLATSLTTISNDATLATEKVAAFADAANRLGQNLPGGGGGGGFFGQLDTVAFANFGDAQTQIIDTFKLLQEEGPKAFLTTELSAQKALEQVRRQNEQTEESFTSLRGKVNDLFDAFQQGGGRGSPTALNEFVLGLQKLAEAERSGLATNDQLAASIESVIKSLQQGDFNVDVGVTLDKARLKSSAADGANIILDELKSTLSPEAGAAIGLDFLAGVGDGIEKGAEKASVQAASAGDKLARDIALAQAAGNQAAELAGLRERERRQAARLARFQARPQTPENVAAVTRQANQLADTRAQIQRILDKEASDTKAAARDAQTARDKTDQALLDMFGAQEARAENAIIRAGSSSLKRQLAAQRAFLIVLSKELEAIRNTVKNAKTRAKEMARVTQEMIRVGQDIAKIRADQRAALKQAAEDRQAALERGIQLDIEFAVTTGNKAAEIAARNREIAFLTKRLNLLKKKKHKTIEETNEIKELRNAIAEQRKALKDLTQEQKSNNAAATAFFSFLQTQAGFAANLLGNLIPGSATAGLVGGTATSAAQMDQTLRQVSGGFEQPRGAVQTAASVAASRDRGVRPIQVDTTNQLLRQILRVLQHVNGRQGHPEARYNDHLLRASFDGVHGN